MVCILILSLAKITVFVPEPDGHIKAKEQAKAARIIKSKGSQAS